jgi:hypothetical protein
MKIRYELAVEDMVVFYRHYSANSPVYQQAITKWIVVGVASIMVIASALALWLRDSGTWALAALGVGLALSALFALWLPRYFRSNVAASTRKTYSSEKNQKALGLRELELTDTALISRGSFDEGSIRRESIRKVTVIDDHAFIFTGSATAFVVPRHGVSRGEFDGFINAIQEVVANNPAK